MIVLASGKNIDPEEIEAHYRKSPFVQEICVMGLAEPGRPSSERLHAVVVPNMALMRARKIVNVGDILRFVAPGMVLTVEPGLYIPPDDKSAPAKYRGIGIRIEDDVLVTDDGQRQSDLKSPERRRRDRRTDELGKSAKRKNKLNLVNFLLNDKARHAAKRISVSAMRDQQTAFIERAGMRKLLRFRSFTRI